MLLLLLLLFFEAHNKNVRPQGQQRGCCSRSGLRRSPQFSHHGLKESLWLLPEPRGLLLSGSAGCSVHPAVAGEQKEASAPDPGGRGAVQAPPAEQEEEGQCAAAGHAQPRDLIPVSQRGLAIDLIRAERREDGREELKLVRRPALPHISSSDHPKHTQLG